MQRILAADIGGTNSRFGFFELPEQGGPRLLALLRQPTTGAESFHALLQGLFASNPPFGPQACDMAVLAVAGPVDGGLYCHTTNIDWDIDLADAARVGLSRALLINDFAAQAWACRSEAVLGARVLQPGHAEPGGVVGVIGAGTGLGHCALVPLGPVGGGTGGGLGGPSAGSGGWMALPSEAGHAVFPFVGEAEAAYGEGVRRQLGRECCVGDDIVTGGGLARLFTHLTGKAATPAEAAAQLADQPQVVEWFARFYGRASRNYALNVLARGGLYLAGGVAAKNPCLVEHPAFLQEFTRSVTHHELLAAIPIFLNSNEESGVYGAALAAEQLLRGATE